MNAWFSYKVKTWDEFDEKMKVHTGITCAENTNFSSAVLALEKYYGNTIEEIFSIKYLDEFSCLELPEELVSKIEKLKNDD